MDRFLVAVVYHRVSAKGRSGSVGEISVSWCVDVEQRHSDLEPVVAACCTRFRWPSWSWGLAWLLCARSW